jgi:hypothetical protein
MNQLLVIYPYPTKISLITGSSGWAFDDEDTGLVAEPFVSGMPAIIDAALAVQNMPRQQFRLVFSPTPFPDYQLKLRLKHTGVMWGNYYRVVEGPQSMRGMEGWLCPATLKYFSIYPEMLFLKVEPILPDI